MMKSCVIESSVETQVDLDCMPAHVLLEDDFFATVPVSVVRSASGKRHAVEDEEELYTSFEKAISERVAAVSRQLSRLPHATTGARLPALGVCPVRSSGCGTLWSMILARVSHFWEARRHALTLLCLSLNLLLLGFDCMGLLVLVR